MAAAWRASLRDRALSLTRPRAPEPLPASLDRRRVYVLPTRFGLFFAVLLLAMLLGALNYNNNPALLLALLLAGAGLASLVSAHLQLTGLEFLAVDAEPVAAGQVMTVRIHAKAPTDRMRRGLQVAFAKAPATRAVLDVEQGHGEVDLVLPTRQRGWLDVPRLVVATTRPLGLARAWAYLWPEPPVLVYPAPEPAGPPLPEGAGDRAHSRLHPAGEDVHHLRSYRAGDARRAIAWKPSARRDQLIVREYEQPQGAEVTLDWLALRALPYEARISRLAGWVDAAERTGRRYRLVLPGQPVLGPGHGPHHRHTCLRALALMPHG
ncbi:DUF58 domain-containing protein [Lysobacter olei]